MDRETDLYRRGLPHLRRILRISQAELAALAGISQQSLSKFEDGSRALSAEALARLQGATQKAIDDRRADAEWGMKSAGLPYEETPEQKEEFERIVKEEKELNAERYAEWESSIPKAEDLPKQLDPYKALLKEPGDAPKILQGFKELLAMLEQVFRNFAEYAAKDYAMFPRSIERENIELKAENAKLQEKLRALGELDRKSEGFNVWKAIADGIIDAAKQVTPPLPTGHEEVTITPDDADKEKPKGGG